MFWLGKLLGALFGFMIAGPFGAVLGLILGHYFDISLKKASAFLPPPRTLAQDIFFQATFTIMGHVAKADGRVSENEIRVATSIMQRMMLTHQLRQQAIHYFRQGKQTNFDIDQILNELVDTCYGNTGLLHLFFEIQLQAAYADGVLSPGKQKILEHICYQLGLNPNAFFRHSSQYEQSYKGSHTYQPPPNTLDKAYQQLGVSKSASNDEIKKAYRRLMSQHHPDKLVSKGLPEEMLKIATQKTQEIKSAYEEICKARGI